MREKGDDNAVRCAFGKLRFEVVGWGGWGGKSGFQMSKILSYRCFGCISERLEV